jgi:hypothetical protein
MRLTSRPDVLRLKAKRDVDGLVQALGYRTDGRIQDAALEALIAIGEPAIPSLIQVLAVHSLQDQAATALRKIGIIAIEPLMNVLRTEQRQRVRKVAGQILADIGMFAIDPLVMTLQHKNDIVRQSAVEVLAAIGSLAVEPLIAQLNNREQPEYVRLEIIKALSEIGGPQATSTLLILAQNDPSPDVRKCAAASLGRHDLLEKPATPMPDLPPVNRSRGLSKRFMEEVSADDAGTDEVETVSYRWVRVRQTLPHLTSVPFDVLQRLIRTYAVHRRYTQPVMLLEDLDNEFAQYSRIKESSYTDVSIRLVFDNEVTQGHRVIPATRQLEVIIVSQDHQFFMFFNATYVEYFW